MVKFNSFGYPELGSSFSASREIGDRIKLGLYGQSHSKTIHESASGQLVFILKQSSSIIKA